MSGPLRFRGRPRQADPGEVGHQSRGRPSPPVRSTEVFDPPSAALAGAIGGATRRKLERVPRTFGKVAERELLQQEGQVVAPGHPERGPPQGSPYGPRHG